MKLECVTVCIGYSDFLTVTLQQNRNFFNKMVVVTDTQDKDTARVCELFNVQCIKTDVFYDNPEVRQKPNKARGINEGLKHLAKDGWVLHMDADIWLPATFRSIMENFPLDETKIYGMDRLMCNSYCDWIKYLYTGKPINEGWVYTHTNLFEMGTRLVKYQGLGYIVIGFFQLWNPNGSGISSYPEVQASFDRTDTLFSQLWERNKRELITDMVCIHLASENGRMGQNWFGRKSRPFRPITAKEKVYWGYYHLRSYFSKSKVNMMEIYQSA